MEAAIDMDEGLSLASEPARFRRAEAVGMSEAARDLAIPIDFRQVLRRGDQREVHRPPFAGLARLEQPDVFRGRGNFLEEFDRLVVRRELVIRAGTKTEDRLRGRDTGRGQRGGQQQDEEQARAGLHGPEFYPEGRGYSVRSAMTGSTRVARLAGKYVATRATPINR